LQVADQAASNFGTINKKSRRKIIDSRIDQ